MNPYVSSPCLKRLQNNQLACDGIWSSKVIILEQQEAEVLRCDEYRHTKTVVFELGGTYGAGRSPEPGGAANAIAVLPMTGGQTG